MRPTRTSLSALALGVAAMSACNGAPTQEPPATGTGSAPQSQAPAQPPALPAEDEVTEHARQALRNAGVEAGDYKLAARRQAQWNDSSLGCPKPGLSYLQVITHGEVLRFTGPRGAYEVHVAGGSAVLCAPRVVGNPKRPAGSTPARNLDKAVQDAREDLHSKLGVAVDSVRLVSVSPAEWPDSNLGCAGVAADAGHERAVGYKLLLSARGSQYVYHTDLQRTFACPPIESQ